MKKLLSISIILLTSCIKDRLEEHKNKLKKALSNSQDQFYNLNNEIMSISRKISLPPADNSKMDKDKRKNLQFCKNELYNISKAITKDLLTSYKKRDEEKNKGFGLSGSVTILANNQKSISKIQQIMLEVIKICDSDKSIQKNNILKQDAESLYYILTYSSKLHTRSRSSNLTDDDIRGKVEIFSKKQNRLEKLLSSLKDYMGKESYNSEEYDIKKISENLLESSKESKKHIDNFRTNNSNNKELSVIDKSVVDKLEKINVEASKNLDELYNKLIKLPLPKIFDIIIYNSMLLELGVFLKKEEAIFFKNLSQLSEATSKLKELSQNTDFVKCISPIFNKDSFNYLNKTDNINDLKREICTILRGEDFKKLFKILKEELLENKDMEEREKNIYILKDFKIGIKRLGL